MIIILWLSQFFWNLRKYFLGVQIDYPDEFIKNLNEIKKNLHKTKREILLFITCQTT